MTIVTSMVMAMLSCWMLPQVATTPTKAKSAQTWKLLRQATSRSMTSASTVATDVVVNPIKDDEQLVDENTRANPQVAEATTEIENVMKKPPPKAKQLAAPKRGSGKPILT